MNAENAYPLNWPVGWPRTASPRRRESHYQVPFGRARDDLMHSLRLLSATGIVLSSNVPLRRDGLPYAGTAEPRDPGVAVYWTQHKRPQVMACDCWRTVRDNVRAIGLAVEGLRAIDRAGASQILERAFIGFAALPASTPVTRGWREVLHLNGAAVTARDVLDAYRRQLPFCHPDASGSHDLMVELNRARDEGLFALGASTAVDENVP